MTRLYLTTFLFTFFSTFSQETAVFRSDTIPATPKWSFLCEQYALGGQCGVQVAKTEKGGLLRIAIPVFTKEHYIGGTVYVYLTDNTVITCTDKGFREVNTDEAVSWYVFTPKEMNRLAKSDIQFIRFAIKGPQRPFTGQTGFFSAFNTISYFGLFKKEGTNRFPTAEAVSRFYFTP